MVTYKVRNTYFVPGMAIEGSIKVATGLQPFPGTKDGVFMYDAIVGERPARPLEPNKWVSDDLWSLIASAASFSAFTIRPTSGRLSHDGPQHLETEARSGEAPNDQGKKTSRPVPGAPHVYLIPVMSGY